MVKEIGGSLYTEMVYPLVDGYPSTY